MSNRFRQKRNPNPTNGMLVNSIVQRSLEPLPYHYTVDVKQMSYKMTTSEQLEHLRLVKSLVYRFRFDWWLKSRLLGFGAAIYTGFGIATMFNLLVLGIVLAVQVLLLGLILGTALLVCAVALTFIAIVLAEAEEGIIVVGIGVVAVIVSSFVVLLMQGVGQILFDWGRDLTQTMIARSIQVDKIIFDNELRVSAGSLLYALLVFSLFQTFSDGIVAHYGWLAFGHLIVVVLGLLKDVVLEKIGNIVAGNQEGLSNIIETIEKGLQ